MLLVKSALVDNVVSCFGVEIGLFEEILDVGIVELEWFGVAVVTLTEDKFPLYSSGINERTKLLLKAGWDNSFAGKAAFPGSNAVSGSLVFFGVIVLFNFWLYSLGIGSSLEIATQTNRIVYKIVIFWNDYSY